MQHVQPVQMTLPIGNVVRNGNGDRYTVEGLLGQGGSGAVYLVRDKRNKDQLFALKELIDPDVQDRARFAFESEVLKRLEHKALPHVYSVFENEKLRRAYILMDYIDGQDLEALRLEQPGERFPLPLVLALLSPIVAAINYLHQREPPIVHRDIKPANIIVPIKADDAMLVDFGLAKEYVVDHTTTMFRRGSPGYAAPEQYGSGTNIRTDVYGLGATLYTLLTGTIPVDAVTRVVGSKGSDPLKPAHELEPTIPLGVSKAIERALALSDDDRFSSIDEFWTELNAQASSPTAQEEEKVVRKTDPTTPLPDVQLDRGKIRSTTTLLLQQRQVVEKKRRYRVLGIALALLALLTLGAIGMVTVLRAPHSVPHVSGSTPVHSSPPSRPSATAPRPFTPNTSLYPQLAQWYTGRIFDVAKGRSTALYLTNIQQNEGSFHGIFRGLGETGPFSGTVDTHQNVHIDVTVYDGTQRLTFKLEATIKIGGNMADSFTVLDQNGQATGEYGTWNADPQS